MTISFQPFKCAKCGAVGPVVTLVEALANQRLANASHPGEDCHLTLAEFKSEPDDDEPACGAVVIFGEGTVDECSTMCVLYKSHTEGPNPTEHESRSPIDPDDYLTVHWIGSDRPSDMSHATEIWFSDEVTGIPVLVGAHTYNVHG